MPEKKLGFIGLGEMGRPMVKNLLNAGYSVIVWNRSQPGIDECVGYGATAGTSPRDVAEKSDLVITMVVGSEDVRSAVLGPNGVIEGAHPGLIVIDTSTISPKVSREVAEKLRKKGVKMLDAPVSGCDIGAKAVTTSFVNSPSQKGVEIANGDRIIEGAGTRSSRKPADAVRGIAAKLQTQEGKEIYRQRKKIVEPVFGQVKFNLGFRRFRLRGVDKADGEWTVVCLVHNIKKIYAKITAKGGEPHDLTRELQATHNPA
ncbi:2-hydroxy-3-oxopropionate reductase [subsurface metagenome]